MESYRVNIIGKVSVETISVEANSEDDAIAEAKEQYKAKILKDFEDIGFEVDREGD